MMMVSGDLRPPAMAPEERPLGAGYGTIRVSKKNREGQRRGEEMEKIIMIAIKSRVYFLCCTVLLGHSVVGVSDKPCYDDHHHNK